MAHYREAHPLPFVVTHWVNLVAMIFLIFTGFYIHYPLFGGVMTMARGLHIFCGIVLLINCVVRMVLAFFIKSAPAPGTRELVPDYKTWLPQRDNKHQLWAWISYYLFLRKEHPIAAKLGVPQKIVYLLIPLLIFFTGYTGPVGAPPPAGPSSRSALNLMGGAMKVRILHYFMMWCFLAFMCIHVYLSLIEGISPTLLMFFWKEHAGLVYDPEKHTIVGEDDLGHGEKH
ncbi:MAG: cytochrome b/b6 domain-containing protein [Senegalimassilia faecalis]